MKNKLTKKILLVFLIGHCTYAMTENNEQPQHPTLSKNKALQILEYYRSIANSVDRKEFNKIFLEYENSGKPLHIKYLAKYLSIKCSVGCVWFPSEIRAIFSESQNLKEISDHINDLLKKPVIADLKIPNTIGCHEYNNVYKDLEWTKKSVDKVSELIKYMHDNLEESISVNFEKTVFPFIFPAIEGNYQYFSETTLQCDYKFKPKALSFLHEYASQSEDLEKTLENFGVIGYRAIPCGDFEKYESFSEKTTITLHDGLSFNTNPFGGLIDDGACTPNLYLQEEVKGTPMMIYTIFIPHNLIKEYANPENVMAYYYKSRYWGTLCKYVKGDIEDSDIDEDEYDKEKITKLHKSLSEKQQKLEKQEKKWAVHIPFKNSDQQIEKDYVSTLYQMEHHMRLFGEPPLAPITTSDILGFYGMTQEQITRVKEVLKNGPIQEMMVPYKQLKKEGPMEEITNRKTEKKVKTS